MHDLAWRPLARCRARIELVVGCADQRLGDDTVAVFVLIDEFLAKVGGDD